MKQCSKNIIKVPKIVQLVCSRSETEFKYFNISLYENKIGQKDFLKVFTFLPMKTAIQDIKYSCKV